MLQFFYNLCLDEVKLVVVAFFEHIWSIEINFRNKLKIRFEKSFQVKQQHIIYKRDAHSLSALEYPSKAQFLLKLNERSAEEEFCDVSKSIDDDANGIFNKTIAIDATAAKTAAGSLRAKCFKIKFFLLI